VARGSRSTLPPEFYDRPVLEVAPELIGCVLEHGDAAGVIVETEAYHESEPACHAFVGLTPRTQTLFGPPGRAYVYRSYGVHALVNAVCEPEGVGAAVLIRALQPLVGIERMRARRSPIGDRPAKDAELCSGPGKLSQALGIWLDENGSSLSSGPIRIRARSAEWLVPHVHQGVRVGINRATELRWRFCALGNGHVSRPRPPALSQGGRSPRAARGRGPSTH
jgi:DNA-3-methyladenine glycosylase